MGIVHGRDLIRVSLPNSQKNVIRAIHEGCLTVDFDLVVLQKLDTKFLTIIPEEPYIHSPTTDNKALPHV